MSQWEVYKAIQSPGGRAAFAQIRKYMQDRHCSSSDSAIHNALQKLILSGLVAGKPDSESIGRRIYWTAGEFAQRNVIVIKNGV